ncbi:LamG domain-containing protein [Planctobacterium marinum]|uniref:LamG domain-containing protein n=1 Tax=Planctobacterium marinum TaxID=1631968 RepID=UPI001E580009|nr:LamG domain-containing protein [Planctobacterium marinum]MCC2605724.1 LamG domain-containing protein [Planctobacterium marinum]
MKNKQMLLALIFLVKVACAESYLQMSFDSNLNTKSAPRIEMQWHGIQNFAKKSHEQNFAVNFNAYPDIYIISMSKNPLPFEGKFVSIEFEAKITGSLTKWARPIWLHGAFGVQIARDGITFLIFTDEQSANWNYFAPSNVPLDSQWHTVNLEYDAIQGTTQIRIDNKIVFEEKNNNKFISKARTSRLLIGSDGWGKTFPGQIDNLKIFTR